MNNTFYRFFSDQQYILPVFSRSTKYFTRFFRSTKYFTGFSRSTKHFKSFFSDQQYILPVRVRDGAAQRGGGAPRDPRLHHQRIRAPAQGGAQDLLAEGEQRPNASF
jgi:hypothetical protein